MRYFGVFPSHLFSTTISSTITIMGPRVSTNVNHVPPDSEPSLPPKSKRKSLHLRPLPRFNRMRIKKPYTAGKGTIPRLATAQDPLENFQIVLWRWNTSIHSRLNQRVYYSRVIFNTRVRDYSACPGLETSHRQWATFMARYPYMDGCASRDQYKGLLEPMSRAWPCSWECKRHMGLVRFEQITRFPHVSESPSKDSGSVFDKL